MNTFVKNNSFLIGSNNKSKLSNTILWLDASDPSTVVLDDSTVSQWRDKSGNNFHATQSVVANQPVYSTNPGRLTFFSTDRLLTTLPATTATLVVGTTNGTAAYGVNIPAGTYDIGRKSGNWMPDGTAFGYIITSSQNDIGVAIAYMQSKGAGINYGNVTNFGNFWRGWNEITSFPEINTGSGTIFSYAWNNCSGLTSFPLLNTSKGINFSYAWQGCTSLNEFPLIDTSAGTSFTGSWLGCIGLTSFPQLNTSSGTLFLASWQNCSNLTSFPLINTSLGTTFYATWMNCSKLISFPLINTGSGTNFYATWQNCSSLTNFPQINTGEGITFDFTWAYCASLTSFPFLNVNKGTTFRYTWANCTNLTSFPASFFNNCLATNFEGVFQNTNLSQQSIDDILVSINSNNTNVGKFGQSGGSPPSSVGQTAITAMRNRGWTITVTGGF